MNVSVVRLPQVHDTVKQGLVTYAIQMAREKGVSAYIGNGLNRWPAAHVLDVARLYRLAWKSTKRAANARAAEEGVPTKEIAEAIGRGPARARRLHHTEEAPAHFGWLSTFMAWDNRASSTKTRAKLGWNPTGPTLLADLSNMNFFPA